MGDAVRGVGVKAEALRSKRTSVCEPCIIGKETREPFPKESDSKDSKEPLELVHMDVCGPMPVTSKGGSRYLATFLDVYSKLSVVQPMKRKSNVTAVTESVFARLELQSGKKVKGVQTNRGGEYVNEGMTALLGKRGTVHRTTAGHSLEQNGSAERLNRTLEERARALLENAGLGPDLWAEAMVTANYTRNRVPSSVHGKSPGYPYGEADTQPGVGATPTGEADTGSEEYPLRGTALKRRRREDTPHAKGGRPGSGTERIWRRKRGSIRRVRGSIRSRKRIHFEEVYAPVSKHTTLRALLAVVAKRDLELHQLDVETAFLNGELEKAIYMQQPQGYEQGGPNVVCHLKRTLNGVRQTPRAWHTRLKEELGNFEFVASLADTALFSGVVDGERIYLIVWVDDILVAALGGGADCEEAHWAAALGVVRYLVGTAGAGITFGGSGEVLEEFCDANYAGDINTKSSMTGYVFLMYGGAVSWSSRLQLTVAASTVGAEYMSAENAVKEALWFHKHGGDLGLDLGTVLIHCDNQGAIRLLKHPIASQRSKHIDVIHRFAQKRVARKEVEFAYCKMEDMKADILTKALAPGKFLKCKKKLHRILSAWGSVRFGRY
ncbi:Transposon-encoded protein [Klebsormidium nitens]|uniref:Transposon-encoded protein n=1 Tax=Klebsormidium nitens TaxID=105231 RepID=A0A1Y1IVI0_KLENI|nr:Transposon-encoded protein [Klebsormidium nitens]|eukprot:GAQ92268.1 Transposon-encoded protein [Klebsormidium nitens]